MHLLNCFCNIFSNLQEAVEVPSSYQFQTIKIRNPTWIRGTKGLTYVMDDLLQSLIPIRDKIDVQKFDDIFAPRTMFDILPRFFTLASWQQIKHVKEIDEIEVDGLRPLPVTPSSNSNSYAKYVDLIAISSDADDWAQYKWHLIKKDEKFRDILQDDFRKRYKIECDDLLFASRLLEGLAEEYPFFLNGTPILFAAAQKNILKK
jgi:hypothetical protein